MQLLSDLSIPLPPTPRTLWTATAPQAVAQVFPSWCRGQWHGRWPSWSVWVSWETKGALGVSGDQGGTWCGLGWKSAGQGVSWQDIQGQGLPQQVRLGLDPIQQEWLLFGR